MLIAGFLAAAYATALDVQLTNWTLFAPAALVALLGVIVLKRQASGAARAEHVLTANRNELTASLRNIVTALDELNAQGEAMALRDLGEAIDTRLRDDLRRFAEARESMVHLFGLQAYADIMSEFAAGERYVNRVWSAAADGYGGEARRYLERAAGQFRHARERLEAAGRP
ncbi:MAG: hypothetical protein ACREQZ_08920 [Woeseiaceae bacterium]